MATIFITILKKRNQLNNHLLLFSAIVGGLLLDMYIAYQVVSLLRASGVVASI